MTAACASRSAQSWSKGSGGIQTPAQFPHSLNATEPTWTRSIAPLHRGQGCSFSPSDSDSTRAARAPQCGQCLLPANIIAKQAGQANVASLDPQKAHSVASGDAAAPQPGQLREALGLSGRLHWYGCHSGSSRQE